MAKGSAGVKFNFRAFHARDPATLGRALKQLVESGMTLIEAREIAGL